MFLNDITQWTSVLGIPRVKASWRFSYICPFVTVKLSSPLKANFKFLWVSNFTLTFFTKKKRFKYCIFAMQTETKHIAGDNSAFAHFDAAIVTQFSINHWFKKKYAPNYHPLKTSKEIHSSTSITKQYTILQDRRYFLFLLCVQSYTCMPIHTTTIQNQLFYNV